MKRKFGVPPKFGDVERDAQGEVVIMWITAPLISSRTHGTVVVLATATDWPPVGWVEDQVSWAYIGWERVDTP